MSYYTSTQSIDFDGVLEPISVLFFFNNGSNSYDIEEPIEDLVNRRLSPTRLLIICPKGYQLKIQEAYNKLTKTAQARLSIISHFKIQSYDIKGAIDKGEGIDLIANGPEWNPNESDILGYAKTGLTQLIESTGVIWNAPNGYVFNKLTNKTSNTFIRAENIFKYPEALGLIFFLSIKRIHTDIKSIYIDSFTILPLVLLISKERTKLAQQTKIDYSEPKIINFHSYSKDEQLLFPADKTYCILISASTSGGLAEDLCEKNGANQSQIIHFLFFSEEEKWKNNSIFQTSLKANSSSSPKPQPILITGEEFIATHGEANPVTISTKHFCKKEGRTFSDPFYKNIQINLSTSNRNEFSTITLPPFNNDPPDELKKWIDEITSYDIPANTEVIIFSDDTDKPLATYFHNKLKSLLKKEIHICPETGIKDIQDMDGTCLIISYDCKCGERLLSISRALREIKSMHRVYISAYFFAENRSSIDRLRTNLCKSGQRKDYDYIEYTSPCIGLHEGHDSWFIERSLMSSPEEITDNTLREMIKGRTQNLKNNSIGHHTLFLPKIDLNPLKIRNDSVLFRSSLRTVKHEDITQPCIYLLVSTALQRAREGLDAEKIPLKSDQIFKGNPFVLSVLDPGMLSRYNDGIIQAALLRACRPSEMNYSSNNSLSKQMADRVISAVKHPHSATGEAVLEMIFALKSQRILLRKQHFHEIEAEINKVQFLLDYWRFLDKPTLS